MKIKVWRNLIAYVLLCSFMLNIGNQYIFAAKVALEAKESVLTAKTAILTDIDEYGSNWKNDITTNEANVVKDTILFQSNSGKNIIISAEISGQKINITGNPIGKTENGNVIYFEGKVDNSAYSVVTFSYEKKLQYSNVYFDGYMRNNNKDKGNLLKIYLKKSANLRQEYIVLESFDYELPYDEDVLAELPIDALAGAWVTKEFKPIACEEIDGEQISTRAVSNSMTKTITKTFVEGILSQTHTISLRFTCDYRDIPTGGETIQRYWVTVAGKTMSVPNAPNYDSATQSYLHVDGVKLRQTSIPYTAWTSTTIDGKVQNNGIGGTLYANIGVGLGALSIAYSVPLSFTNRATVDVNDTYSAYENYLNNYTRHIQTQMNSKFKLTQVGYYFYVGSTLSDYGNASRDAQLLKAKWVIDIINANNHDTWTYTYDQNVLVAIH